MQNNNIYRLLSTLIALFFIHFLCINYLFTQTPAISPKNQVKIIIDAGHGGIDKGVYGKKTGVDEASINLTVAKMLKKSLNNLDFSTSLTRENQDGLYGDLKKGFKLRDMEKRKAIIQETCPKLVISLHCNYSPHQSSHGINLYYNKNSIESKAFMEIALENLKNHNVSSRIRCDSEEMYITYKCNAPAVIIEMGFLSNAEDENKLIDEKYLKLLTKVITASCVDYFSQGVF